MRFIAGIAMIAIGAVGVIGGAMLHMSGEVIFKCGLWLIAGAIVLPKRED
jgi:formate hydrogenlyase subunit 3/multisubunit Na+/H+ antiporter MnhD subunit